MSNSVRPHRWQPTRLPRPWDSPGKSTGVECHCFYMTNLDSILQSRDITLPTKVHLVKAMAFLVVVYGCESWTIKKAECQRIDAFSLWMGESGSIPGLERFPGEGNGNPLRCSCLENLMGGEAWWATVHRIAKNQT